MPSKSKGLPGARKVSISEFRSYVFYGRSGTGKTTLACSFPGPILLLDIRDDGTDSVSDVKGLEVQKIENTEEIEDTYYWLKENPGYYSTVVIDTVSQWQQLVVKEIIGDKGRKGKTAGDWGSMTKQDWGKVAGVLKEWFVNFRDLVEYDYNIIFIAQDRVSNAGDEEGDRDSQITPEVGPAVSPSIAKVLNASVSVIGNTCIDERIIKKEKNGKKIKEVRMDYVLRLAPNSVYTTKVRKPKSSPPSDIRNPSYEDIIEIIKGE